MTECSLQICGGISGLFGCARYAVMCKERKYSMIDFFVDTSCQRGLFEFHIKTNKMLLRLDGIAHPKTYVCTNISKETPLSVDLHNRCCLLIEELGLGEREDVVKVVPLTGGVASDIALVELADQKICAKFALPKLKVQADWFAPVQRNAAEYAWLMVAARIFPESAVRLLGRSEDQHGFAMEFIDGPEVYLWKSALLSEASGQGEAARVAEMLGQIHATSARADFDTTNFRNRDDFRALRIEPYLIFVAKTYPELASVITRMAERLYETETVLVHGDVSPKNIFFRREGPVLLDAECATIGDAIFDPAFCLNHLVLKAVHLGGSRRWLLAEVLSFWKVYSGHVSWEDPAQLEKRICCLLPMLMLARVDGKSPVEYLSSTEQAFVRTAAIAQIRKPAKQLRDVVDRLSSDLREFNR